MSVVLRCPNCGTNQAGQGECEACHEAKVRYFCTNHEPGLWLSGPACPQCEALVVPVVPVAPRRREPPPVAVRRREPPIVVEESEVDLRPPRSALWKNVLGAVLARTARPPDRAPVRGWVGRLVLRLVLIAVVLLVAAGAAVYWLVHAMP